ncbi:hypothetical protein [Mycoplasmopsis bovirhinis]|uniref:hypothetical protein n=1 Tax=Mycoplasmopsis bovirhinis TaxID=29553 RepID=UPI000E770C4E|nr:hypothetical protein [Mycoplasmopsis bovirhinis]
MTILENESEDNKNHVDQNLEIDKYKSGKNFADKTKLNYVVDNGANNEANSLEQWEKVGLDLENKLVFYKANQTPITQSQSDYTTNTEAVEVEWSKVELYVRTSGSNKNFGNDKQPNHSIPKEFKLFYSRDVMHEP